MLLCDEVAGSTDFIRSGRRHHLRLCAQHSDADLKQGLRESTQAVQMRVTIQVGLVGYTLCIRAAREVGSRPRINSQSTTS